jgi:chromosome segregation ATPase
MVMSDEVPYHDHDDRYTHHKDLQPELNSFEKRLDELDRQRIADSNRIFELEERVEDLKGRNNSNRLDIDSLAKDLSLLAQSEAAFTTATRQWVEASSFKMTGLASTCENLEQHIRSMHDHLGHIQSWKDDVNPDIDKLAESLAHTLELFQAHVANFVTYVSEMDRLFCTLSARVGLLETKDRADGTTEES